MHMYKEDLTLNKQAYQCLLSVMYEQTVFMGEPQQC